MVQPAIQQGALGTTFLQFEPIEETGRTSLLHVPRRCT